MKNSEFKSFHPFVNLIYFVFAVGFSCILLHPAFLLVSLITGLCYSYILNGKSFLRRLLNIFISMVFMGLINPLFNHQGATILTYFPSGNPLTKESLMYGAFTGVMIASVLLWFGCFNCIFTTDKIIYPVFIPDFLYDASVCAQLFKSAEAHFKNPENSRQGT